MRIQSMLSTLGFAALCAAACNWTTSSPSQEQPENSTGGVAPALPSGGTNSGQAGAESVEPEVRLGERGASCNSSADCEEGLACLVSEACPAGVACANKSCQPSDFAIEGTGKQCSTIECATKADCCGDKPLETPEKCAGRDTKCFLSTLPGCVALNCTEDSECGSGTCHGYCAYGQEDCTESADCAENICELPAATGGTGGTTYGTCSLSGSLCLTSTDCAVNYCTTPYCDCANPEYAPEDPICTDEECEGACGYTCESEHCVPDTSCRVDDDCFAPTPHCVDGACVECASADDCDDEECIAGSCGPECEDDAECPLFSACASGKCTFIGCQTDRECILGMPAPAGLDPRLFRCVLTDGVGSCVIPCEFDAQCAANEVCVDGTCTDIGCETDSECKTILGLANLPTPTEDRPWSIRAVCREPQPVN